MTPSQRAKLEGLLAAQSKRFAIERFCFKEQLEFIRDQTRFKTAVCSRRAGKTVACAAHLIHEALQRPRINNLYVTLSRLNAKRILWRDLLDINRVYELRGEPNETELVLRFPNGSSVFLAGANDKSEIEKFRGQAFRLVYLDECQSFPAFIEELVDQVLAKALFDYDGTLCLIGTPGPVPVGYFYSCSTSSAWSHHSWTMFQNPHLERKSGKKPEELVALDCARMGVTLDHPKIQRECFGKWVHDLDSLVFRYEEAKNDYANLPQRSFAWNYVYGVDLGFDDSDAIAILGWQEYSNTLYLIHEDIRAKQGITELSQRLEELLKIYPAHKIMIDAGALGKKIAHEIQTRHSIPVHPAEKTRKLEYIELLNDAMRTRRFMAKRGSRFATDCKMVEWDPDVYPPRSKISERFHSDICDATLYAYREAIHWLEGQAPVTHKCGTAEWAKEQERIHEEAAATYIQKPEEDIWQDVVNGE